jgi:hypothetical protein
MTITAQQIELTKQSLSDAFANVAGIAADISAKTISEAAPFAARAAIELASGSPTAQVTINLLRAGVVTSAMTGAIRANRETAQRLADITQTVVLTLARVAVAALAA